MFLKTNVLFVFFRFFVFVFGPLFWTQRFLVNSISCRHFCFYENYNNKKKVCFLLHFVCVCVCSFLHYYRSRVISSSDASRSFGIFLLIREFFISKDRGKMNGNVFLFVCDFSFHACLVILSLFKSPIIASSENEQ